jgi:chorismate mutase
MTDDEALAALRRRIDSIDDRIVELLAERVSAVLEIGELKRQSGAPIYDPARERSILERLSRHPPSPLEPETVRRVFERLIDESRWVEGRTRQ